MAPSFGNDSDFHLTRQLQDLVSKVQAEKPSSPSPRAASQEKLGHAFFARILNQGLCAVLAVNDLGRNVQVLCKPEVAINSWAILRMHRGRFVLGMDVHCDADGLQMVGY